MIGFIIDGVPGAIGALNHIQLDSIQDKGFKNMLEYLARMPNPSPGGGGIYLKPDRKGRAKVRLRVKRAS